MSTPLEEALKEGIRQLSRGSVKSAHPFFVKAFQLNQEALGAPLVRTDWMGSVHIQGDPLVISYYALGHGIENLEMEQALKLAKWAVAQDKSMWELHLNLAHLFYHDGNRAQAYKQIETAHRLGGDKPRILELWDKIGRRQPPALSFLPRGHFINRQLGKLRKRLLTK